MYKFRWTALKLSDLTPYKDLLKNGSVRLRVKTAYKETILCRVKAIDFDEKEFVLTITADLVMFNRWRKRIGGKHTDRVLRFENVIYLNKDQRNKRIHRLFLKSLSEQLSFLGMIPKKRPS